VFLFSGFPTLRLPSSLILAKFVKYKSPSHHDDGKTHDGNSSHQSHTRSISTVTQVLQYRRRLPGLRDVAVSRRVDA
jgi:hypothetical protein